MENGRQEEREEGRWREVPALLKAETVQAAVRNHLESKGLGARQLEPRQRLRRPRMAGKKPPLPPQAGLSEESVCFGVALEAPQPKQLLEPLDGRGMGAWLPRVFAECVRVLRENVGVAGIFRKSGSLSRQRVLRRTLECGEELPSPNVHDMASVLKQYLRELPTPLLPPSIGPALEWAWSCEKGERVEIVMCALLQLPHPHLQMARELCNLMSLVASHQSQSLMDSHSLAVVMTPNIMPTQHSNPANLEAHLTTSTGVVELMVDHAHLIGLVPTRVINHAHQLAKESESAAGSNESLETGDAKKDKQKRISVTDKVLGWGTKLMSTLGGGPRDVVDHSHSPFGRNEDGGGLQMGKYRLFDPSLPLHSRATPKTPRSGHKRHRSFLSARRHTDGRHGHRSLFTNPFRGPILKGGEFSRLGSARLSEQKFPWLQGHTPMTPDPDVQLVGFGVRSSLTGDNDFTDGDFPNNVTVGNPIAMTPVLGNNALLASLSEESVSRVAVGEGEKGEEGERKGERIVNEGVEPPKTYSVVSRKHSGKRMRCEEEEGGRAIKRRHTIYTSGSRESLTEVGVVGIRTSKSATALGQTISDLSPGFTFSKPTPQRSAFPRTPHSVVPVETDKQDVTMDTAAPPTSSGVRFTFSNPRHYVAKRRLVSVGNSEEGEMGGSEGERVCGASPIPHLPELTPHKTPHVNRRSSSFTAAATPAPRGQLNEGFLKTPFPRPYAGSPNLLQQISSELIERYPRATPLATPTAAKGAGLGMNDSYCRAVYSRQLVKPVSLEFTVTPDPDESSEIVQEVSFTFQLNHSPGRHSNTNNPPHPSNTDTRVPLSPSCHSNTNKTPPPSNPVKCVPLSHRRPVVRESCDLRPQKAPLQRRFAMTPLLTPRVPRFTDISSPFTSAPTATVATGQKLTGKTPRVGRRAQMYVIPSTGSHGNKENRCTDVPTREWIV